MNEEILVSVVCNAYNHEKYIRDALESFISQKTDFKYEVLIHDDASTDGTPSIIREYEEKYPNIIKPIYQKENQYSKGVKIGQTYQFPRAKGKYIAMCEGDDYWIDSLKLQKQVSALEAHPNVDICAHAAIRVKADTKELIDEVSPDKEDCILSVEQVILGGGGYVATNSLLYRKKLNENIPEFRKFMSLDYTLQIHGALEGGMLYLKDCMSAYRWMAEGSWTSKQKKDFSKRKASFEKLKTMYEKLDAETSCKYSETIRYREMKDTISLCEEDKTYRKNFLTRYKDIFKHLPWKEKFVVIIKVYFPTIVIMKRKLTRGKVV